MRADLLPGGPQRNAPLSDGHPCALGPGSEGSGCLDRYRAKPKHKSPAAAHHHAFEEAILNVTHQALGEAILPPLLAALRTRVSQSLRSQGNGENADTAAQWEEALRSWRAASAVLLDGGNVAVGFFSKAGGEKT